MLWFSKKQKHEEKEQKEEKRKIHLSELKHFSCITNSMWIDLENHLIFPEGARPSSALEWAKFWSIVIESIVKDDGGVCMEVGSGSSYFSTGLPKYLHPIFNYVHFAVSKTLLQHISQYITNTLSRWKPPRESLPPCTDKASISFLCDKETLIAKVAVNSLHSFKIEIPCEAILENKWREIVDTVVEKEAENCYGSHKTELTTWEKEKIWREQLTGS